MSGKRKTGCLAGGCGFLLAVLGIGVLVNLLAPHHPSDTPASEAPVATPITQSPPVPPPVEKPKETDGGPGAYYYGKSICEKALKAPATAKFSSLSDEHTGWNHYGYNQWNVFGHVDAQNSFGALIREDWEAVVEQSGPFYQLRYFRLGDQVVGKMPPKAATPPPPPRPLTPEEKLAAQILAENRKAAADLAIFKYHYQHAVAGDPLSQRRLAELYTAGQGCDRDTNAAAAWLRAAATNSPVK